MKYPILSKILISGAAIVACALTPNNASADDGLTAAVEVGANIVTSDLDDDDSLHAVGPAVALRLGYSVYGSTVRLTPEAKFSFEAPGTPRAGTLMGGARINFPGSVSPAVFGHAGGLVGDLRGFVWDAGGGLDFILNDTLDIGFYGAFFQTRSSSYGFGNPAFRDRNRYEWIQLGGQLAIHF